MTSQREVSRAFRPGKRAKKVLQPRAARHQGHPHPLPTGADMHRHPMPDSGITRTPKPSNITRHHTEMVERNLEILDQAGTPINGEVEIYKRNMAEAMAQEQLGEVEPRTHAKREAYVALQTHKEMASTILGAGGTFEEAADWAGVSRSTVAKWYADEEFRRRVDEQRAIVKNKVGGRIEAWMDRRTADPEALDAQDPRITLQIYDRVAGPAGGRGAQAQPSVTNVNILGYSDLMDRAIAATARRSAPTEGDVVDAGGEGRGFPLIGPGSVPVAGGGSQSD